MNKQELFDYLASDANQLGLDPIAAHGFLTATVVGKPLPNWLSAFFEGGEAQVSDEVKDALKAWQQELYHTLKAEEPIELPFDASEEAEDFSEEGDLAAWAIGFVDAMHSDENVDWFDDESTEEDVAELTLPMVLLSGIDPEMDDLRDEEMLAQMANALEDNITELFLLFHTDD
ncbi:MULTISPECIES: YecA family protein [unclassified Moraxella]|uniref:YecA/YgfB family protein n=1 Tax=unclassified Moraxella TaxID=2685852 RepID=UPI002B4169F0|nr:MULTISPECIES: YecA family protein [unclassified Moraxella]